MNFPIIPCLLERNDKYDLLLFKLIYKFYKHACIHAFIYIYIYIYINVYWHSYIDGKFIRKVFDTTLEAECEKDSPEGQSLIVTSPLCTKEMYTMPMCTFTLQIDKCSECKFHLKYKQVNRHCI